MWKTQKSLFSFSNDWGPGVFWKPVQVSACHGEQESQSTGASLTGTPNPTRRQQLSLHRGGRVQAGRPGTRPRRQLERQPPGLRAVRAAPVPWPYTPAAPKHSEESETQPVTATRSHQGDALLCVVPALGSAVSVEKARFLGGVACGRRGVSPRWARCSKVVTSGLSCCSPGLPACPSALSSEDLTPAAVCVQEPGDTETPCPRTRKAFAALVLLFPAHHCVATAHHSGLCRRHHGCLSGPGSGLCGPLAALEGPGQPRQAFLLLRLVVIMLPRPNSSCSPHDRQVNWETRCSGRNDDFIGKAGRPRRWGTSVLENHLPQVRTQAPFVLKVWLVVANFLVSESFVLAACPLSAWVRSWRPCKPPARQV
ncbi:uncharacterized protein [Vicugna pacos]|uniref:Uncharacterized protein isoform X1 n=1 Tax=Vicugna pacos TaxID=30538 RepID=A0ABM5CDE3_VICPA